MESLGWRTVVINNHAKLSLYNGNLKITGEERTDTVPLSQIRILMINTGEATVTSRLMSELSARSIKTIFCDESHLPSCEVCSYNCNVNSAGKHYAQIAWSEDTKSEVWAKIVKAKIFSQYNVLKINHVKNSEVLREIASSVNPGNAVIQEALAARLYFAMLFGENFNRRTSSVTNAALNYGYSILLSSVSRAITLHGYLTSIGINHCSKKNPYNLSCDIMEPFRPYIDNYIYRTPPHELSWDYKQELININLSTVIYNNRKMELQTALDMYVNDVLTELTESTSRIGRLDFYE